MKFFLKLFTGGFGLVANYAMIGGIVLALLGFLYWQFTSNIADKARLESEVLRLNDVIAAKNDVISIQRTAIEIANRLSVENQEKIDAFEEASDSLRDQLSQREDGKNQSSEYLKEYFRLIQEANKK